MSARISRSRAAMAVAVFAVIVAAFATIQAAAPTNAYSTPCLNTPCPDLPNVNVGDVAAAAPGMAVGTVDGSVVDTQHQASDTIVNSGNGPEGLPGVVGAPASDGTGTYEDVTGQPFANSTVCANATATATRSALTAACDTNNKYACWDDYAETQRKYTSAIYWDWITEVQWCGYSLGSITSHSYNDHWGVGTGFNCSDAAEQRVPLEKVNKGHWQEHSNFTFRCSVGGLNREDHATEGFNFYSNGYDQRMERGGS